MDYQQYLDEKIHQLRIICQSQWDYVQYSDICAWLDDNFGDDLEGRYYAIKILLHTVYYKKKDIEKLLLYGLHEKIYGEIIKDEMVSSQNIFVPNSEACARVSKLKNNSFFIPLLDSNKPSESGNSISGDLVHKLGVSDQQVDFHWNVTEEKLKEKSILIFVDDCIGSGKQLKRFWNSPPIQAIKKICNNYNIRVFYLVLVGYDKNLSQLRAENKLEGIDVVVCDLLTDKNRIFSDENIVWDRETEEREKAISYFEKLKCDRGINFTGFTKLDFAVILHDRLPNWSLPIFWKQTVCWKLLIKRKTS